MSADVSVINPVPDPEPDLCTVGNFVVSEHWVRGLNGTYPLAGSRWDIVDRRESTKVTPAWAVICAILFVPITAFLSLLLLIVKETRETGFVEVAVSGPGFYEASQIHNSRSWVLNMGDLTARVAYIRSLVARLS